MDNPAKLLQAGKVIVMATDTVYGLVCRAADQAAVQRLYSLKHREHKPGTVIAASVDDLVELGLTRRYLTPVASYWPGPVSVIIPSHDLLYLHQGVGGLAVRIPNDPSLLELLEQTGPLLTSSANQPGEPVANTIAEARAYFNDDVDAYFDGGDLSGRESSTVLRVVDDEIEILRQGAAKIEL